MSTAELSRRFACFGAEAGVQLSYEEDVPGAGEARWTLTLRPPGDQRNPQLSMQRTSEAARRAAQVLAAVEAMVADVGDRLTRFDRGSELCALNADGRMTVPVSPLMIRFVRSARWAATLSGGLVDAALLDQLERSGYVASLPLSTPRRRPFCDPRPRPARARRSSPWSMIECQDRAGTVTRPPRTRLDSGGIAKGMAADMAAQMLADESAFVVDCAGDLRVGGAAGSPCRVAVEDPFDGGVLAEFELCEGGIATSGILRRCWSSASGESAHHLIDPCTGRPAFTGVVQVTAVAPTALEAEARAKAALLAGPQSAASWLPHGGVVVLDDGRVNVHYSSGLPGAPGAISAQQVLR